MGFMSGRMLKSIRSQANLASKNSAPTGPGSLSVGYNPASRSSFTPEDRQAYQAARDAAMGWTPPPPPVINNRRQAPAPTAPGGAWGGMLAPNPSAPPVPGLPDPAQMQQTSDQQTGLMKKGSIWDRMARGQGSLSGGMQPKGGV